MELVALAADSPAVIFIQKVNSLIVNPIIILLFSVALVVFIWGVVLYIKDADNSEARDKGTKHILWGVIGMAIMVMAFGIIKIVVNTFGIGADSNTSTDIGNILK